MTPTPYLYSTKQFRGRRHGSRSRRRETGAPRAAGAGRRPFGSHVRGTTTTESDVDVAVAFDGALTPEERHQARIDLIVDLMETLGRNDIDVTDLDGTRPAVGASALRTGIFLVGDEDRVDALREDFETRTTERTHEERMRRFDLLLDRLADVV